MYASACKKKEHWHATVNIEKCNKLNIVYYVTKHDAEYNTQFPIAELPNCRSTNKYSHFTFEWEKMHTVCSYNRWSLKLLEYLGRTPNFKILRNCHLQVIGFNLSRLKILDPRPCTFNYICLPQHFFKDWYGVILKGKNAN